MNGIGRGSWSKLHDLVLKFIRYDVAGKLTLMRLRPSCRRIGRHRRVVGMLGIRKGGKEKENISYNDSFRGSGNGSE